MDKVIFRKWKDDGQIIALFPDMKADMDGNITSYMHIGQHSAASPELIKDLMPATKKEYEELLQELISIGYKIKQ